MNHKSKKLRTPEVLRILRPEELMFTYDVFLCVFFGWGIGRYAGRVEELFLFEIEN